MSDPARWGCRTTGAHEPCHCPTDLHCKRRHVRDNHAARELQQPVPHFVIHQQKEAAFGLRGWGQVGALSPDHLHLKVTLVPYSLHGRDRTRQSHDVQQQPAVTNTNSCGHEMPPPQARKETIGRDSWSTHNAPSQPGLDVNQNNRQRSRQAGTSRRLGLGTLSRITPGLVGTPPAQLTRRATPQTGRTHCRGMHLQTWDPCSAPGPGGGCRQCRDSRRAWRG